jgi:dienelactone hydrolase
MKSRSALALAALIVNAGCVVREYALEQATRPTVVVPDEVAHRFAYTRLGDAALARLEGDDEGAARVFSGSLTIDIADDPEPMLVQFEYWQAREPKAPRAPAIVITPILGGGRALAVYQCRSFVEAGMHAVLVERGTRVLKRSWPIAEVERQLRRAVAARRAVVDWLEERPEVDPTRLGAFGISMGGEVTSVLLAMEPRLGSGIVALAGADVPGLIRDSDEGRLVEWRQAKAAELGISEDEVEARLREALVSDPGAVARYVDPRRVLFISTRWDEVVMPEYQERLWEGLGRPARYDLAAGHYSGVLYLPWVMDLAIEWLEARFASVPDRT